MKNILSMMKQAKEMQQKMTELQNDIESIESTGQSGGGLVQINLKGKGEIQSVAIDDSLIKVEEKDILQDLIVAAYSDAKRSLDTKTAEKMREITGGMALPDGFKMPF